MALFGDIKELKEEWRDSSGLKKTVIILVFFLTLSSIASLSDVLFSWKGFFLDGIEFYDKHVNLNVRKLLSNFGVQYNDLAINILTLATLSFGSFLRVMIFLLIYAKNNLASYFMLIAYSAFLLVIYFRMCINFQGLDYQPVFMHYASPIILMVSGTIGMIIKKRARIDNWENTKNGLYLLWGPIVFGISIVLLLGAINAGIYQA